MLSLQKRLGSGLLISLTIVFGSLWLVTRIAIEHLAEEYVVSRLSHDSESLLAAVQINTKGQVQMDSTHIAPTIYQRPFSGHYYRIQSSHTMIRSRSLWDQDLDVPLLQSGEVTRIHTLGPLQQHLLILVRGYQKQDIVISIAIAEDLSQLDAEIAIFQRYFAITAGTTLFILIVLQILILRGGLHPLHRITHELRELGQGQRHSLEVDTPHEIAPLVHEVNRLLVSNIQRVNRSRNAMADLAHALKRPLTVIQQHLQEHRKALPSSFTTVTESQLQNIRHSIEHILRRANLAGSGPAIVRLDAHTDIQDLINSLQHMYFDKQLHIDYVQIEPLTIAFDRQDMLELLGNLLDNACKWARHLVRLELVKNTELCIKVEDDGPGVADTDRAKLLQRGNRLDESTEGHGLGLAIVKDIVDQYNGHIDFSSSDRLGGLCVQVNLPIPDINGSSTIND